MKFIEQLHQFQGSGLLPGNYSELLLTFYNCYKSALEDKDPTGKFQEEIFSQLLNLVKKECQEPFKFEPYHQIVRHPIDYHQFGLDFTRPLLHKDSSSIVHENHLKKILSQLQKKENVILLANHQTELDPQIMGCLLEDEYSALVDQMIFVAGQKVITDLLAIPFSMGCNLLCIYSKRHIDHDPELKQHKQQQNLKTMKKMSELLKEGGKCIYVAPSGGRDRKNAQGVVEVAKFDPDSIEMFRLMALQAKTPTHFYPLALSTYDVLPPPSTIEKGIGEKRFTQKSVVHISFADEVDMQMSDLDGKLSKHEKREVLASRIQEIVEKEYAYIKNLG